MSAELVNSDCWKELVAYCCRYVGPLPVINLSSHLKELEAQFKKDNKIEVMPTKYRSSKSVILRAMERSVELLDSEGIPRSKSTVEMEVKQISKSATTVTGVAKTPDFMAMEYLNELQALWPHMSDSARQIVKDTIKVIAS